MRFKLLLKFLVVLFIIFSLIWLIEILFFEAIYQKIKTVEINSVGNEIVENYDPNDTSNLVEISIKNDCTIIIFEIEGTIGNILYSSSRTTDIGELNMAINTMLSNLGDGTTVNYTETTFNNYQSFTFGQKVEINDSIVYFYVNSMITPVASTVNVLTFLLLIITIVSFIITFIISLLFSKKMAEPISNIANSAKKLSSGNLDVNFDSREYDEVAQLSDTLNYAVTEIRKSDELRKEVIANVSHELRTPLTMIKSYAELINDISGNDTKKRKEHLKIILQETDRLEFLVNDILVLSKLQSGVMKYEKTKFSISKSLTKLAKMFNDKYKNKGFNFKTSIEKNIDIIADKNRIEQSVINLLNNAINYSKDNKNISIGLFLLGDKKTCRLEVKDNGVGISEENQKNIFNRHFRSVSATRTVVGNGIGLSIVKQILEFHKYRYGVESRLGKGSTFYIEFPIAKK